MYDAIQQAKPGNDLAFAIRDGLPFDKLKDESIAQVATAVVLFAQGVAKLEQEAKTASEQGKAEAPAASSPETTPAPRTDKKK